jgi:putative intracellular protease/amidase
MRLRTIVIVLAAIVGIAAVGAGGVFLSFPSSRNVGVAPRAVTAEERASALVGLRPPKRARPLIAIIGANEGSETTDYLIPYGVLKRSGVVDVVSLGETAGPVKLMPALTIVPDSTIGEFDQRYPDGADYVIVPAFHNPSNRAIISWLKAQTAKHATVIGICEGAWVLANAGLLDGHNATTIWASIDKLRAKYPSMRYVTDRRLVVDRGIVTTTGVTASLPLSLALVEAIAGRERADSLAQELGAPAWSMAHTSAAFRITRSDILAMLPVMLGLRRHETVGIRVAAGIDEVSLAFVADAYASTQLASVAALSESGASVVTANGMKLVPDGAVSGSKVDLVLDSQMNQKPALAFNEAFEAIAKRYGDAFASLSRLALEYPEPRTTATAARE